MIFNVHAATLFVTAALTIFSACAFLVDWGMSEGIKPVVWALVFLVSGASFFGLLCV